VRDVERRDHPDRPSIGVDHDQVRGGVFRHQLCGTLAGLAGRDRQRCRRGGTAGSLLVEVADAGRGDEVEVDTTPQSASLSASSSVTTMQWT
jgi:hypothetical protein